MNEPRAYCDSTTLYEGLYPLYYSNKRTIRAYGILVQLSIGVWRATMRGQVIRGRITPALCTFARHVF